MGQALANGERPAPANPEKDRPENQQGECHHRKQPGTKEVGPAAMTEKDAGGDDEGKEATTCDENDMKEGVGVGRIREERHEAVACGNREKSKSKRERQRAPAKARLVERNLAQDIDQHRRRPEGIAHAEVAHGFADETEDYGESAKRGKDGLWNPSRWKADGLR